MDICLALVGEVIQADGSSSMHSSIRKRDEKDFCKWTNLQCGPVHPYMYGVGRYLEDTYRSLAEWEIIIIISIATSMGTR